MEEEAHIQEFLCSLESLYPAKKNENWNTKHQSEKLLLLEEQIKEELGELLGREINISLQDHHNNFDASDSSCLIRILMSQ